MRELNDDEGLERLSLFIEGGLTSFWSSLLKNLDITNARTSLTWFNYGAAGDKGK